MLFGQQAGIKLVHVPYPGSPESVTDLIAGRITMSFVIASSIIGQINAGQLTALASTGAKRASVLPDVPTMTEAGISGFDANLWHGLLAPAGAPQPIIAALADATGGSGVIGMGAMLLGRTRVPGDGPVAIRLLVVSISTRLIASSNIRRSWSKPF